MGKTACTSAIDNDLSISFGYGQIPRHSHIARDHIGEGVHHPAIAESYSNRNLFVAERPAFLRPQDISHGIRYLHDYTLDDVSVSRLDVCCRTTSCRHVIRPQAIAGKEGASDFADVVWINAMASQEGRYVSKVDIAAVCEVIEHGSGIARLETHAKGISRLKRTFS